jgi:hypothetical protein
VKKALGLLVVVMALTPVLFAQEHYTEGPVWRVQLVRVKPTQMDAYLSSLRKNSKPILEEEKRQGMIVDYKFFLKQTKNSPEDWDLCIAVQYKNWAAMDGLAAKTEMVRDKVLGGKQQDQQVGESRLQMRELITVDLLQEIELK